MFRQSCSLPAAVHASADRSSSPASELRDSSISRSAPWRASRARSWSSFPQRSGGTAPASASPEARPVRRRCAATWHSHLATTEIVLVHDAAHPLATPELAATLVRSIRKGADAAVPVLATHEVIAHVDGGELRSAISRDGLVIVQMPHTFRASVLRALHTPAQEAVDDSVAGSLLRLPRVVTVEGEPANVHVTDPRELELVRRLVAEDGPGADRRPGQ